MEILGKRVGLAIGLFILGLIFIPSPGKASPMPNPGNNLGDMRSALKFLQDMDSYYGQIARPRYQFYANRIGQLQKHGYNFNTYMDYGVNANYVF